MAFVASSGVRLSSSVVVRGLRDSWTRRRDTSIYHPGPCFAERAAAFRPHVDAKSVPQELGASSSGAWRFGLTFLYNGSATVAPSLPTSRTALGRRQRRSFSRQKYLKVVIGICMSSVVTRALLEPLRGRREIPDPLRDTLQDASRKFLLVVSHVYS